MPTITHAQVEAFGGAAALEERVTEYVAALAAHADTVDQPRPAEHDLVEMIATAGGWATVTVLPPEEDAPPPGMTLEQAKAWAERVVNTAAGATRTLYITTVPGQSLTYDAKRTEAQALVDGATYAAEDHPLIAAEILARADAGLAEWTPLEVAQDVLAAAAAWTTIGAAIERQRRARVMRIGQATTPEEATAPAGWTWPPADEQ